MGGKSSKPTIGYWYRYLIHLGLGQAIDALLEFRGGERTAWAGRAEGGTVAISARELWGGEKAEGGIEGELDVMLGLADQDPNPRLTALLGDQQSAYRNRSSVAFEGLYGAFNPYPKAPSFKVERIYQGWQDDVVWYPEKAKIGGEGYLPGSGPAEFLFISADDVYRVDEQDWGNQELIADIGIGNVMDTLLTNGDNLVAYQVGVAGSVRASTDGGATWVSPAGFGALVPRTGHVEENGTFWISSDTALHKSTELPTFVNTGEDSAVIVGAPGFLLNYVGYFDQRYSINSGATWTPCTTPLANLYFGNVYAHDGTRVACIDLSFVDYSGSFALNTGGPNWVEYLGVMPLRPTAPASMPNPIKLVPFKGKWVAFFGNGDICYGDEGDWDLSPFLPAYDIYDAATDGNVIFAVGENGYVIRSTDGVTWIEEVASGEGLPVNCIAFRSSPGVPVVLPGQYMNPAHILYDSLSHSNMEGLPTDLIDDAGFRAAADVFYDEGFGLCARFNPVTETVEAFQKRICNVVGASLVRSRVDGRYYLTPMRGVHDLESLPVLEDDDILEYEEEPSDPLESVNQVSVEWFDPEKKKKRTTAPLQSLGAIQSVGGIIAEVASYPEIPYEELALRVGARDLAQKATPLKRFRLTTNRVPYAWRAGQYFRLQAPRRGIADMVCLVGEIDAGTPRSGSMRLVAIQDVSTMPLTVYVVPEPGVDTSPSQEPSVPPAQKLMEAPYVELVGALAPADLESMTSDAGYLLALAARPESGLNFALYTAAAGETLADRGAGDWCPSALVVEAATRDPAQVDFTIEDGSDLNLVAVGAAALWGEEIVRVDAINATALTITLGRGCADTTPQEHAAGERIWFYDNWAASDQREYASGETVEAKVLTRTESKMLDPALAPTLSLELGTRAARPYPPGRLRISDAFTADMAYPSDAAGVLAVSWAHRDRLLQADQLVDESDGNIGPEPGVTYTVRCYVDNVLDQTFEGLSGTSHTFSPSASGLVRIEVESVRGTAPVAGSLNGGFEDATPAWTPDPANTGGGTFTVVNDPAEAKSGDYYLEYAGVPGPDGSWTEEVIIGGAEIFPTTDLINNFHFGCVIDVPDINASSQILVYPTLQFELRARSDDTLLSVYGPVDSGDSLRGWGKLGEGWAVQGRVVTNWPDVNGFQVYLRPVIKIRSIPQGTPPAGFTVKIDDVYGYIEGTEPVETGALVSWQAATAEFNWLGISARATDSEDIRITDSGDTRVSEG